MAFDMDMHVKKEKIEKPIYAVVMKRKIANITEKFFIVIKKGEFFQNNVFHGIGFWSSLIPDLNESNTQKFLEEQDYLELWIPYENIDHIRSLVYIKR